MVELRGRDVTCLLPVWGGVGVTGAILPIGRCAGRCGCTGLYNALINVQGYGSTNSKIFFKPADRQTYQRSP